MDWKERVRHYSSGGTSAAMADEDMAARSIVSALFGSSSKTHLIASRLGVFSPDRTEFELARSILDSVSGGMFHPTSSSRRFVLDVRKASKGGRCWSDDGELEELCSLAASLPDGMVVLSRMKVKDSHECVAFAFLKDCESPKPYVLRPVSTLIARSGGIAVWRRKARDLFKDMADCMKWETMEVR